MSKENSDEEILKKYTQDVTKWLEENGESAPQEENFNEQEAKAWIADVEQSLQGVVVLQETNDELEPTTDISELEEAEDELYFKLTKPRSVEEILKGLEGELAALAKPLEGFNLKDDYFKEPIVLPRSQVFWYAKKKEDHKQTVPMRLEDGDPPTP